MIPKPVNLFNENGFVIISLLYLTWDTDLDTEFKEYNKHIAKTDQVICYLTKPYQVPESDERIIMSSDWNRRGRKR
jgi:hypothetical protein